MPAWSSKSTHSPRYLAFRPLPSQAALLVASGFVGPSRRRGARQTYTFQDLWRCRAAKNWSSAALARADPQGVGWRAWPRFYSESATERLRVVWMGNTLGGACHRRSGLRSQRPASVRLRPGRSGGPRSFRGGPWPTPRPTLTNPDGIERSATQWLRSRWRKKRAAKQTRPVAAYRQALAADPGLPRVTPNLGTLAYNSGRCGAARASSRQLWPSTLTRPRRATT